MRLGRYGPVIPTLVRSEQAVATARLPAAKGCCEVVSARSLALPVAVATILLLSACGAVPHTGAGSANAASDAASRLASIPLS